MTDTVVESNPEEVAVSKWPTIWKYSLIIAVVTFIYTLILYITGMAGNSGLGFVSTILFIVLLVFGLRKYRIVNGGYMTFGTAAIIGIMITVFSTVLRSALNFFYLAVIDTSVLPALKESTLQQVKDAPGANQQTIEMMTKVYDILFTPAGMFVIGCISGIIVGIIIALILAAILKKSPPIEA